MAEDTNGMASILVVDDDPDLRVLVKTALEQHDFHVRLADSGEAALREINVAVPALVLLDVQMPGMDGIELARRIRAMDRLYRLPIVFLTALDDPETQKVAMQNGGNDFLSKPFTTWELVSRVRALISVTDLHLEVERCYQNMSRHLEALSRARNAQKTMTVLVAHDMRSPITSIVLGVDHALSVLDVSPNSARESLEDVKLGAAALQTMLSDLLDVEIAADHGMTAALAPVNLEVLISEVARLFEPRAEVVGLALKASVDGDLGRLLLDRGLLLRTLANLVDNALRYAPKGSEVILRARREAGGLVIEVVDQGPGVSPDLREQIFEKFSRAAGADPGRKQHGLGLSFCRLAARAHGGDVVIEQAVGGGTSFRVTLPLTAA